MGTGYIDQEQILEIINSQIKKIENLGINRDRAQIYVLHGKYIKDDDN